VEHQWRPQAQQQHQEAPDPPAPDPAPTEPAKEAPKAEEKPPKASAREPRATLTREQRAALADKVIGKAAPDDDGAPEKPAAKAEPAKAKADDKAKPEPKAKEEPAKAEEKPEPAPDDRSRSELADLLKAGQLEELAEKLGVDRKVVEVSNAKLRLARGRNQEADAKLRKATEAVQTAEQLQAAAKKEYGAPHKAREAYDKGEFADAAQWIAQALDDDFASITRNIANATKGMDAKELGRFTKDRELRQREAALTAREKAREQEVTAEQRTARAVKTIDAKCAGHDALKLQGGSKLILRRLEDAFDPKSGKLGIGYQQAADQVLAEFMADAKALGLTRGEQPAKVEEKAKPEPAKGKKEFPAAAAKGDAEKTRGLTFEERQARAARAYERNRI
jgi:hypothetical protein